jgi:hypothetical protein
MDQIKFRPGEMLQFISTRSFTLGATGVSISDGMEILFDGTTAEIAGQKYSPLPQLRGAIRQGWIVLAIDYDPEAPLGPAPSANIQVRAANDLGQNPMQPPKRSMISTVESDERIVMNRGQRAEAARQQTADVRSSMHRGGGGMARGFGRTGGVELGGAEFGVPVARAIQTPARAETKVTPDSVGRAIRDAELVKVQPGEGMTERELLSRMDEDERARYLEEKESRKADVMTRAPGYVPPRVETTNLAINNQTGSRGGSPAPAPRTVVAAAPQHQQVARIQSRQPTHSEGISTPVTVGRGGTEVYDASGSGGKPTESVVEVEGMMFRNTNGPKPAAPLPQEPRSMLPPVEQSYDQVEQAPSRIDRDGTGDVRKQMAKSICPDFPDTYEFSDHWKRRLATIRYLYETRHDIIRAIFVAESDDFKKVLLSEFPEAFGIDTTPRAQPSA